MERRERAKRLYVLDACSLLHMLSAFASFSQVSTGIHYCNRRARRYVVIALAASTKQQGTVEKDWERFVRETVGMGTTR